MRLHPRHHERVTELALTHEPNATLHAHGVWSRQVTVGGARYQTQDYVHIYTTATADRFLVIMPAETGMHVSYETGEAVTDILGEMEGQN